MPTPRKHPTGSAKATAHINRVKAAGGRRFSVLLSPEATAALAELRTRAGLTSDRLVIDRALIEREAESRPARGKQAPGLPFGPKPNARVNQLAEEIFAMPPRDQRLMQGLFNLLREDARRAGPVDKPAPRARPDRTETAR